MHNIFWIVVFISHFKFNRFVQMCNRYFIQPKLNLLVAHNPTGRLNIQSNAFLLSNTAIDSMGLSTTAKSVVYIVLSLQLKINLKRRIRVMQTKENQIKVQTISLQLQ